MQHKLRMLGPEIYVVGKKTVKPSRECLSDRIRRLVRCNTCCTLQVVLLVFEPLLFRGVGYRQQPIHVS